MFVDRFFEVDDRGCGRARGCERVVVVGSLWFMVLIVKCGNCVDLSYLSMYMFAQHSAYT